MRTGGTRRDAHARRDQPGVLALGDPHQHLHLARSEHLQQPGTLVVRLRCRMQQFLEGLLEQLRRDRRLAGPRLHHGAFHALDPLVVPYVSRSTSGERGGDTARIGHRPEHHHRDLRPLLLDPYDRVEGARLGRVAVPSRHTSGARLTTRSAAPALGAAAASTRCPRSFKAEASASASSR